MMMNRMSLSAAQTCAPILLKVAALTKVSYHKYWPKCNFTAKVRKFKPAPYENYPINYLHINKLEEKSHAVLHIFFSAAMIV